MNIPVWLTGLPSTLTNRITWRLAAALGASVALVAVVLTLRYPVSGPAPALQVRSAPPTAPTPLLSPVADSVEVPSGHLNRLISFCASMVTSDRTFVVFANGTCVIVNEPSLDPVAEAVTILGECSSPNARFITKEIEHGNILVTYQKPAFHCLFEDEVAQTRPQIEQNFLHYLTAAERSQVEIDWEPPFHAKLGLVARHRLNEDATDLQVAKVIKARPVQARVEADRKALSLEMPFTES